MQRVIVFCVFKFFPTYHKLNKLFCSNTLLKEED